MAEELTPEQQKALEQLSESVATQLAEGKSKEKIVKQLVKSGYQEEDAIHFVANIERKMEEYKDSPQGRTELASKYARRMLYGILWAVGGTIVTAVTYESAKGGGTYVVAWGAILFGVIDFFRGLFGWLKYKD